MKIEFKPFLSIAETAGKIQHIMAGTKYLVNIPSLFSSLGLPWPQVISETTPDLHSGGHGNG